MTTAPLEMRNATGNAALCRWPQWTELRPRRRRRPPATAAPLAGGAHSVPAPPSATSGTAVVTPSAVFCNSSRLFIVRPSCLPCRTVGADLAHFPALAAMPN